MNGHQAVAAVSAAALMSACSTVPPQAQSDYTLVDPGRTDMTRYAADYEDCARLAAQADVVGSSAGGAVIGAVIGGVIGAIICGRQCAAWGAGLTATHGAASGAGAAVRDQQITVRNCLAGRGYNIIR